jgi:hypothetical protein
MFSRDKLCGMVLIDSYYVEISHMSYHKLNFLKYSPKGTSSVRTLYSEAQPSDLNRSMKKRSKEVNWLCARGSKSAAASRQRACTFLLGNQTGNKNQLRATRKYACWRFMSSGRKYAPGEQLPQRNLFAVSPARLCWSGWYFN